MPRHRVSVVGCVVTLGLALVSAAEGQRTIELRGNSEFGEVSGRVGGSLPAALRAPANSHYLLGAITIGERQNRPCYVRAYFYTIVQTSNGGTRKLTTDEIWDDCGGGSGDHMTVAFPRWNRPGGLPAIRSIRVCNNGNNHRVKGIRLRGELLAGHETVPGRVGMVTQPEDRAGIPRVEAKRTNCGNNEWRAVEECPGEFQAANGLQIRHNEDNGVVGLGLICRDAWAESISDS